MKNVLNLKAIRAVIILTISLAILFGFIDSHSIFTGVFFLFVAISEGIRVYKKSHEEKEIALYR